MIIKEVKGQDDSTLMADVQIFQPLWAAYDSMMEAKKGARGRLSSTFLCFPLIILSLTWELTCPYPRSGKREGRRQGRGRGGRGGVWGRPAASQKWMCGEAEACRPAAHKHTEMSVLAVNRPLTSPPRQSSRLNTDVITAPLMMICRIKSPTEQSDEGLLTPAASCSDFSLAR